jgi:hypothetical protein
MKHLSYIICIISSLSIPSHANEITDLKQIVMDLNSHVVNLEKRVKELEGIVKSKPLTVSMSKMTWRKLKKNMSPTQVKNILGEPRDIEEGAVTYWYYAKNHGTEYVMFYSDKASQWKEPKN